MPRAAGGLIIPEGPSLESQKTGTDLGAALSEALVGLWAGLGGQGEITPS